MSTWLEYNFNKPELKEITKKLGYTKPLHMTLAHFPRNIEEGDIELIAQIVEKWTEFFPNQFRIESKFDRLSEFDSGAVVVEYIIPKRIYEQRLMLLSRFYEYDIKWSNNYDWNPHVTVGLFKDPTPFYIDNRLFSVLITGVTLHHSFGSPIHWELKI